MNAGFLSFPINLPGTQLWRAVKARETLVVIFQDCLSKAKSRMATPGIFYFIFYFFTFPFNSNALSIIIKCYYFIVF